MPGLHRTQAIALGLDRVILMLMSVLGSGCLLGCAQVQVPTSCFAASLPAHHRLFLRLRGGAQGKGKPKMVYSKHEAMDGRVDLVREETASDDIGEPFDGLMKLINETSLGRRESGARVGLIARTRVEASHAGIAPRRDWWDHPETTREEVARYLRAQDETFADADDHPRVNAALAHAATYGLVRSIRELVAQGAQVNAGGAGGSSMWAPLHHAARHKRRKAVRALLDLGARVNISTWGRWTPLHFAVAVNDRAITRMLLDAGADMYAVNSDGQDGSDESLIRQDLADAGFSTLVNAAAKAQVPFRAPQMPRNLEGDLPYLDLMVGESDDHIARELEKHDSDRPPDSVQEFEDFGVLYDWHEQSDADEVDDDSSSSWKDDDEGEPDEDNALAADLEDHPEEWTLLDPVQAPYHVEISQEPPDHGDSAARVGVSVFPNATSPGVGRKSGAQAMVLSV